MGKQELDHLQGLLRDFPASFKPDQVEEANKLSYTRFNQIINDIESIRDQIYTDSRSKVKPWLGLAKIFHRHFFQDIISIAGEFRQSSHPNRGRVSFGGQKQNEMRPTSYGVSPEKITLSLAQAFLFINNDSDKSPDINALHFYQLFVRTHPFYDGNG